MVEENGSRQDEIVENFEEGAYEAEDQLSSELEQNRREITQRERENEEPVEGNVRQVSQDADRDPGLREVGAPRNPDVEPTEQVFKEIYETVGFNADQLGFVAYPVQLAGMIDINVDSGEVELNIN